MLILVSSVSLIVQIYSLNYMSLDPFKSRFLSYIALFTFFMIILITSSNLGLLFLGWEGVGICSFLLISFWSSRISASKAALKAIIFNRLGDMGFFFGIGLIFFFAKSLDLHVIYLILPLYFKTFVIFFNTIYISVLDLIFFFIFFGVMGKSAQLGLHVWLLDAMEGPTPVSALIHAATMVTAGIYLLIRLSFILEFAFYMKSVISFIGILTTFFSSLIGFMQNDIKSIIAYSTCSQLGYMVALCGYSSYLGAFFHLLNHGFFKALLFLSAGIIIHNFREEQDLRKMGGLFTLFPLTYIFVLYGSLSLIGIPFLSGYYSKDYLLEILYISPFFLSNFVYNLGALAVIFTCLYSVKLIFFVFIDKPNGFKKNYESAKEVFSLFMFFGLFFLFFGSIFSGFLFSEIFSNLYSNFFFDSVFFFWIFSKTKIFLEFYFLQNLNFFFSIKLLPLFYIICGGLSFIFFKNFIFFNYNFYIYMHTYLFNGFFFNFIYIYYILGLFWKIAYIFFLIERVFFEHTVGPKFWSFSTFNFSYKIFYFYNFNKSYFYNFFLLFFFILLIILIYFSFFF